MLNLLFSQNERPTLRNIPDEAASILESCWAADASARPEFEEITVLLTNLLSSLCSGDSSCAATTSSEEADLDEIEDPNSNLIQECNCHVMKPKEEEEEKKRKNKVVNLIRPVFKMFRACLYKPWPTFWVFLKDRKEKKFFSFFQCLFCLLDFIVFIVVVVRKKIKNKKAMHSFFHRNFNYNFFLTENIDVLLMFYRCCNYIHWMNFKQVWMTIIVIRK